MLEKTYTNRLTYKVSEIVWDIDGQECDLPIECLIDVWVNNNTTEEDIEESISDAITDIEESISEAITDMVSFCHKGFKYEVNQ
jgi:hypothetical protein